MSNTNKKIVIVQGLRTPFAKAGKELKNLHPSDLGAYNLKKLLLRLDFPQKEIEEVLIGNVANLPDAANIARVIALKSGLDKSISASTVHRNCASSLESLTVGFAKIKAGMMDTVIAGGVESMSQIPLLFSSSLTAMLTKIMTAKTLQQKLKSLTSLRFSSFKPRIALLEALTDPFTGILMGDTAEILAREFNISREKQDEFALQSHKKAIAAEKKLQEEITPIFPKPDYPMISKDTGPRANINVDRMKKMRPYFDKRYGTVTIANSCPITDGSCLLVLMSEEKALSLGLKPLASIKAISFAGLEPERMGLGPVYSTHLALQKAQLSLKDMGLIEINEAFASQVLACLQAFNSSSFCKEKLQTSKALGEIDPKILNVNGGAIALGHPVSATGARLALTLALEMKRKKVQFGLATLCIGGGQGGSVILERYK
ncbi:MAG: thiolase family protein [Bdellovibrionales bacterium]